MAEELPDGTYQGYSTFCPICRKTLKCNMQGDIDEAHQCIEPPRVEFNKTFIMHVYLKDTKETEQLKEWLTVEEFKFKVWYWHIYINCDCFTDAAKIETFIQSPK